jgi:hypothetical protein
MSYIYESQLRRREKESPDPWEDQDAYTHRVIDEICSRKADNTERVVCYYFNGDWNALSCRIENE